MPSGDRVIMDPVGRVVKVPAPFSELQSWLTPNHQVFVVAHMGIAQVDADQWDLTVDGLVDTPQRLSYERLRNMRSRVVISVLECAGNPFRPGEPVNRVANVKWTGVPLVAVLAEARMKREAKYVWLESLGSKRC